MEVTWYEATGKMATNKMELEALGHNGANFWETWVTWVNFESWATMGKWVQIQTKNLLRVVSFLGDTLGEMGTMEICVMEQNLGDQLGDFFYRCAHRKIP